MAEFYFVDHADKKYFSCTTCKLYHICNSAEAFLSEASEEARRKISEHVQKSADDEAAVIYLENTYPNKKLTAIYVKRTELKV